MRETEIAPADFRAFFEGLWGYPPFPWQERLLRLPPFLNRDAVSEPPSPEELRDGFALTGFFLTRHVLEPRGQAHSDARAGFIAALGRLSQAAEAVPVGALEGR